MKKHILYQNFVVFSVLFIFAVLIPRFSPIRLIISPASYTLTVHVPIFIGMFISPLASVVAAIGTTLGFYFAEVPAVIIWRANSHILFALIGAVIIRYKPDVLSSMGKGILFAVGISFVHAFSEMSVVAYFAMRGDNAGAYFTLTDSFIFVGVLGLAHSLIDFTIALLIRRILITIPLFSRVFRQPNPL
jgi:niacin transporter